MNIQKPKIGLLLLTAEWFIQVGATQGAFSNLPSTLEQDAARIEASLSPEMEVINSGVLTNVEQVHRAIAHCRSESVEAVVAVYITWGEDRTILEVVRRLADLPLLLWVYSPFSHLPRPLAMVEMFRASGPVGALQASGPLKRLGKRFGVAFGSYENPQAIRQVVSFAKAASVAARLRHSKIGVLPYRCDQMTGTYVDEFRLKHELGPELKYISTHDYRDICQELPESQVLDFIQDLKTSFPLAPNLTEKGLERGARVSLGLARVVERFNLDAIAIEDVGEELHRVLGLRPCLPVPELFERAVVSMEAEVGGAVALLILRGLTGQPVMYTEIFTLDESENCLLLGHAGMQDARLVASSDAALIEPDGEYLETEPDSAWLSFRARGGPVTLLSVFCDVERFKLVVCPGEALPGPRLLLGSPHAYVRIKTPLAEFFEIAMRTGVTQHWALVHADVIDELTALADILDLELVSIHAHSQ